MTFMAVSDPLPAAPLLGVFVKAPRPGEVKTRLGRAIGMASACEVYAGFLADLFERLRDHHGGGPARFFVGQLDGAGEIESALRRAGWKPEAYCLRPQRGADLGQRLEAALEELLAASAGAGVIVIGSDAPLLEPRHLASAAAALARSEVVLGPAEDGGYYLIGARSLVPGLFRDMPWSTPQVLALSLERLRAAGVECALLEPGLDVDTFEDLRRLHLELERRVLAGMPVPLRSVEICRVLFGGEARSRPCR
jgi:hypothetical protein